MIQQAKLPIHVPFLAMQQEVRSLGTSWQPHFNSRHYEGSWTVLSLRSPNGETQQIIPEAWENQMYADTPLMKHCPTITMLLATLHCPLMAVRLMNLKSGSIIKEHRDHDLAFEKGEARLHFPVFTNPLVMFYVNGDRAVMQEGECWYVNVNLPHKVANEGKTDRIHLVVDCRVNNWLKELFAQAEKVETRPQGSKNEIDKIIQELRWQNTEGSKRLAEELEAKRNLDRSM